MTDAQADTIASLLSKSGMSVQTAFRHAGVKAGSLEKLTIGQASDLIEYLLAVVDE